MHSEGPGNQKNEKTLSQKQKLSILIPSILREMFALLKIGIQKMRNISVNSPKRCGNWKLMQKAYSELDNEPLIKAKTGIMNTKIQEIVKGHPNISSKDVLRLLSFSYAERDYVESTTSMQWQSEEWYIHKTGFITASKCKRVFTRQEAI